MENLESSTSYHHGNLRETLLIKGLELLESSPKAEFSMRELTRSIGVSANAVYRHFASKDELLTALAIQGFQKLLEAQLITIQEVPHLTQAYVLAGRQYIDFAIQNPMLFRLMYGRFVAMHEDETLKSLAKLSYTGMIYVAANSFGLSVDSLEAKVIAMRVWSVVHGLSHLIVDGQFDDLSSSERDQMIERVLSGIQVHDAK